MGVITEVPERVYERIIRWADRDEQTGCLVSRYSVGSHGYAQVGWHEKGGRYVTLCHLALWVYLEGQIPEGMTVDHKDCKNRKCVEKSHLRLLTNFDNARRSNGKDWPLGQCVNGHPDSEIRVYWGNRRRCRICWNNTQREYRVRVKARTFD